jgi:hypothetical protein
MNSRDATAEVLKIKGIRKAILRAEKQAKQGKTIPFSKVRRKV